MPELTVESEAIEVAKKAVKKPDLGYLPRFIWLERRVKRISKAIADADSVHQDWQEELLDTLDDLRQAYRSESK